MTVAALVLRFAVCLSALSAAFAAGAADGRDSAVPLGQLPDTAVPERYRLTLTIDPDQSHFSGHTEIDLTLNEPADGIWLHGKDLNVRRVLVRRADEAERPAVYRQRAQEGVAHVSFGETLPPGPLTLVFDYRAPFNDSLEGLYRVTVAGRRYATTQFEATSARLAFPGFDEPRFKVPFDITLQVRAEHDAVTNTPATAEEPGQDGFVRIQYARTRPLPTYLVAFVVGPWDERLGEPIPVTALRDRPIPLRGFAAAGKGAELDYALRHTADIVIALENYFGTAYPYRKLDVIAVPDFAAGAMENAGAITYREQLLLIGAESSPMQKQSFASVHAHELAHQWFGNLVTPLWWNDIWLNEAFATWMAAKVMHRLDPEGGYAIRQLGKSLAVMREDALASARRIRQPIETHADIGSAFDRITYDKGGAMLSMLERFVGEQNFERGIQQYMRRHRFGNASARDFVRAIAATRPDLPEGQVEQAFFSFLEQPGTPRVRVDWTCPESGAAVVSVEQRRYLPLGSRGDPDQDWLLPICFAYGADGERAEHCELVRDRNAQVELPAGACPSYLMPNADAAGYYRFALSAEDWQALIAAPDLSEAERLAIAASLSGAFHAGELAAADYLGLLPGLLASESPEVLSAPLADLEWMHDRLLTKENQRRLRSVLARDYADAAARVPLDQAPANDREATLQREMARLYALLLRSPAWRRQLGEWAVAYVAAREPRREQQPAEADLPEHLRATALAVAVESQGEGFSERLLELFRRSDDAVLREEILRALSYGAAEPMLARLRELALTEQLRDNEVPHVLEVQLQEADSRDRAWDWLLANFDAVAARLPYWFRGRIVEYGGSFCSSERVEQIERQLGARAESLGGGPRSLARTVERIRLCEALVRHHEDALNGALSSGRFGAD